LIPRPEEEVEVQFTVTEGESADNVYERLEKEGVIGNALMFRLENILKSEDTDYKPGTYALSTNMTTSKINSILRQDPENTDITILILEGYSIKDIATYLTANGVIPEPETDENGVPMEEDTFTWASHDHEFKYRILEGRTPGRHWLEGYLFPDTYRIRSDMDPPHTADSIINKMLTNFEDKYYSKFGQQAAENGLTMNELITIASIIEKDFPRADERSKGAAVIYNRLGRGMNLRMPSTLLYALDEKVRLDRLTADNVNVNSPYNTYRTPGLPPGPVCNPGEACIQAALEPEEGDLLYCVLIDEENYRHFFTDNEEEYLEKLKEYNKLYN
jgi:UPF0755 protein